MVRVFIYVLSVRIVIGFHMRFIFPGIVSLISSSRDSSNFEKFVKMLTSCSLTILTNKNAHEQDIQHSDWPIKRKL